MTKIQFMAGLLALCFLRRDVQAQETDAALRALYDSHRWFALRKTVAKSLIAPAPFYKAAVETAFHQDERAKIDLKQYIASHPALDMSVEAHELLLGMEFRSAQYQDALLQAQQILALRPDAKDVANFLPTLKVLAPFVRQAVVSREASTVRFELLDQNLVLPVTMDGSTANYILDNGFSLSGMSESEAKRLKLAVHTVSTEIDTNGAGLSFRNYVFCPGGPSSRNCEGRLPGTVVFWSAETHFGNSERGGSGVNVNPVSLPSLLKTKSP